MIDPIKRNQEHIKAQQDSVTKQNLEIRSVITEEERKEFEAVSQAFKILSDAGVTTYMFPLLMTPNGRRACFQYNNVGETLAKYKNGVLEKESMKKISYFQHMSITGIVENIRKFFCGQDKKELSDVFNFIYITHTMSYDWYHHGIEPDSLKELDDIKDE